MDVRTRHAYASHATEIARRHLQAEQGVARYFARAFSPGDRILDVGAGSGRDLAELVSEGYAAYGVEPVAEMRDVALRAHPHLDGRLVEGALPDSLVGIAERLGGPFDGILCSAVLQHLPRHELFDAVFALRGLLRPGGRLLVSVPVVRPGIDASGRDEFGRLFTGVTAGELSLLFQRVGFRGIGRFENADALDRAGIHWATLLFELEAGGEGASARPLDRIEAVLQRDRKSSTYKLALLRALTEVATTQARIVTWRADGRVGVPVEAIADLWLTYYWQIFDSELFLPQSGGESSAGSHKLAFAGQLYALRKHFHGAGGLAAFLSSHRRGALDSDAAKLLAALQARLQRTIRDQPVRHAGASTSGKLFLFEGGQVLVGGELWQELALMSHWVHDSLLVRWAELTQRFASAGGRSTGARDHALGARDYALGARDYALGVRDHALGVRDHALGVLLEPALDERQTAHARKLYEAMPEKECAWSGRALGRTFDVDHIIPFTLWRNNDLWNLVPAAKQINNQKRDLLPTRMLLRQRRSVILDYWRQLAEGLRGQFTFELSHLAGGSGGDFEAGFDALTEAVETTALQRGCARWAPP